MADPGTLATLGVLEFGRRKFKKALEVPDVDLPTEGSSKVQKAGAEERKRRLRARGFKSTILTPLLPQGLKQKLGE